MPRTVVVGSDDEEGAGSEVEAEVTGSSPSKYRTSTTHRRTMELLASIGGSARPQMPTDEVLRAEIMNVLTTNSENLEQWNAKMIRHAVETKLDISLKERRQWLRAVVKELIAKHFTADSDEGEGEGEETSDGRIEADGIPASFSMSPADGLDSSAGDTIAGAIVNDGEVLTRPPGTLGLMMPARLPKGPTMLVQLASPEMSFSRDTGAIGRISVADGGITIDLRGSQYATEIRPAPTLMVVNVTNATTARIEAMVDEFCELKDGEDMMERIGERMGAGTAVRDSSDSDPDESSSAAGAKAKGKGRGGGARKKLKR